MLILKDIQVSPTMPPVTKALWIRPFANSKIKVYYPKGGEWKEITGVDSSPTPDPTPVVPEDYERLKAEVQALGDSVEFLYGQVKRLDNLGMTVSSMNTTLTTVKKTANRAEALGYAAFMSTQGSYPIPIIQHPVACTEVTGDDLANYGITVEILDSLYEMEYTSAAMLRSKFVGRNPVTEMTDYGLTFTDEDNEWKVATFVENTLQLPRETVTISREKKTIPGKAGSHYVYTVVKTNEGVIPPSPGDLDPLNPGGLNPGGGSLNP